MGGRHCCAHFAPISHLDKIRLANDEESESFEQKKGDPLGELLRSDPLPGHIHLGSQLPGQVHLAISYLLWKTLAPNCTASKRSNSDRPSYCSHSGEDRIYFYMLQN